MRRALHLTATTNTIDGDTRGNPDTLWDLPLLDLFAQMVRLVCGNGTILIHPSAAAKLRLPVEQLPTGEDARKHPVALELRAAGWRVREIFRWFHVKHPDYGEANIGLTGFIDGGHNPMMGPPAVVTAALAQWHDITGHAWVGAAGDAGNEIFRSITYAPYRGRAVKRRRPEFWSWAGPTLPALEPNGQPRYPAETWYVPSQWRRPVGPEVTEVSSLDRVRAYLGAMTCTPVAAVPLEHTPGKLIFDKGRAGWWQVRLGPWDYADLLPDPAGYPARNDPDADSRIMWLTSPRVALLDDVARAGDYEYEILDSWTAPATDILKQYGTELRKAWAATTLIQNPEVQRMVRAGVKEAYRQAHGHWRSHQSSVQLPYAASALVAQNATNTWRRAYELAKGDGSWAGPYPVQIDTDSLYYPGPMDHVAQTARDRGWTVWDAQRADLDDVTQLGHWRTGRTIAWDAAAGGPVRTRKGAAA